MHSHLRLDPPALPATHAHAALAGQGDTLSAQACMHITAHQACKTTRLEMLQVQYIA